MTLLLLLNSSPRNFFFWGGTFNGRLSWADASQLNYLFESFFSTLCTKPSLTRVLSSLSAAISEIFLLLLAAKIKVELHFLPQNEVQFITKTDVDLEMSLGEGVAHLSTPSFFFTPQTPIVRSRVAIIFFLCRGTL